MKGNSTNKWVENAQKQTNNRVQNKENSFEVKYGNRKKITERLNGWIIWKKNCKDSINGSKADIHRKSLRGTLKNVPNWKTPNRDDINEFWFEKSRLSMKDWLLNWVDA